MMWVVKLYHKDRHRKESKGGFQPDRKRGVPCLDDSHGYFRLRQDSVFKQGTLCMLWISHSIIFMVSGLHSSPVPSHLCMNKPALFYLAPTGAASLFFKPSAQAVVWRFLV